LKNRGFRMDTNYIFLAQGGGTLLTARRNQKAQIDSFSVGLGFFICSHSPLKAS